MIVKMIEGATRMFGAPKDWSIDNSKCVGLPVKDVETDEGPFMISAWEPSPEEIKALLDGATIKLWVRGTVHPVVSLTVL